MAMQTDIEIIFKDAAKHNEVRNVPALVFGKLDAKALSALNIPPDADAFWIVEKEQLYPGSEMVRTNRATGLYYPDGQVIQKPGDPAEVKTRGGEVCPLFSDDRVLDAQMNQVWPPEPKTMVEFIPRVTSESTIVKQVEDTDPDKALASFPHAEFFFFYTKTEENGIETHSNKSGIYYPGGEIMNMSGKEHVKTRYGSIHPRGPMDNVIDLPVMQPDPEPPGL
jgi:hypothetical protein